MSKFSLLILGVLAFNPISYANEKSVLDVASAPFERVAVVDVVQGLIAERVMAEGIAQGIRREYLNFEKGGRVTLISTDENGESLREGSFVRGPTNNERYGQLLASIDERADKERLNQTRASLQATQQRVFQAESNLVRVENNLSLADEEFKRIESIYRKKLIPKKQFDVSNTERLNAQEALKTARSELVAAISALDAQTATLNQAKVELEKTSIYAPFDGVLRTVNIRQGDYFSGPAQSMTEREREASSALVIVDTNQYEATFNIPTYLSEHLTEGQVVYISGSSFELQQAESSDFANGQVAKGVVFSVSPSISLDKRSIRVKVHTTEGAKHLKDGMYVSAWIFTSLKEDALLLPTSALISRDNRFFVYVIRGTQAWLTQVEPGSYNDKSIEILSGLKLGDKVVTTGNHKLVHGTHVQVVEEH